MFFSPVNTPPNISMFQIHPNDFPNWWIRQSNWQYPPEYEISREEFMVPGDDLMDDNQLDVLTLEDDPDDEILDEFFYTIKDQLLDPEIPIKRDAKVSENDQIMRDEKFERYRTFSGGSEKYRTSSGSENFLSPPTDDGDKYRTISGGSENFLSVNHKYKPRRNRVHSTEKQSPRRKGIDYGDNPSMHNVQPLQTSHSFNRKAKVRESFMKMLNNLHKLNLKNVISDAVPHSYVMPAEAVGEESHRETDFSYSEKLCGYVYENIIGNDKLIHGPYGSKRMIYCDFVASGRPLKFIEGYIRHCVLPLYANTHSEASACAEQTSFYRKDARDIIKDAVHANEDDVLIFVGSGSTAAIFKLVAVLKNSSQFGLKQSILFASAFEHHSNLFPWIDAGATVMKIRTNENGAVDLNHLESLCAQYHNSGKRLISSISAASNVTGIITDTVRAAEIMHRYGGLAFFDYACGAPYLPIDMNPTPMSQKDAIFISAHKFMGGPGSPGILIAKKFLFTSSRPSSPAGGTVSFVSRTLVLYSNDIEVKEEGGTPDIIGSIKAGLAFQLKSAIKEEFLMQRENYLTALFFKKFKNNEHITILGSATAPRLPIFSFVVIHPASGYLLHQNFVGLLLNDLFGIQSRPGCACAGPYAMDLLQIDENLAHRFANYISEKPRNIADAKTYKPLVLMRTGFTRINLPFIYPNEEIEFILDALEFVVENGWYFLPQYTYDTETAVWKHRFYKKEFDSLKKITYDKGEMHFETLKEPAPPKRDPMKIAWEKLEEAKKIAPRIDTSGDQPIKLNEEDKHLRWFLLPREAVYYIERMSNPPNTLKVRSSSRQNLSATESMPYNPIRVENTHHRSSFSTEPQLQGMHYKYPSNHDLYNPPYFSNPPMYGYPSSRR